MSERPTNFKGISIGELHTERCSAGLVTQGDVQLHIGKQTSIDTGVAVLSLGNFQKEFFIAKLKESFECANEFQINGLVEDLEQKGPEITTQEIDSSIMGRGLKFVAGAAKDLVVQMIIEYVKKKTFG